MRIHFKATAIITAMALACSQIVWAAPLALPDGVMPVEVGAGFKPAPTFDIPPDLAIVKETHGTFSPDEPTFIYIEDAHANYDAQLKIKELLKWLHKEQGIDLALLEGATSRFNSDRFRFFPKEEYNRELADALAKKGLVTGAELFLLEADKDYKAMGIESHDLYVENLKTFRRVLDSKQKSEKFLAYVTGQLIQIENHLLNPGLKDLLRAERAYKEGTQTIFSFLQTLTQEAKRRLNLDFTDPYSQVDWPQFMRLALMERAEKELDQKKMEEESHAFLARLRELDVNEALIDAVTSAVGAGSKPAPTTEYKNIRLLFEHIYAEAEPKGLRFENYPALTRKIGLLIFRDELIVEDLEEEMTRLTDSLSEALAENETERTVLRLAKDIFLLKEACMLELTQKTLEEFRKRINELKSEKVLERIHTVGAAFMTPESSGATPKVPVSHVRKEEPPQGVNAAPTVDAILSDIDAFYRGTESRDEFFIKKAFDELKANKRNKAVLITGGFHTANITQAFKERNASYMVLTPHLTVGAGLKPAHTGVDRSLYYEVMTDRTPTRFNRSQIVNPELGAESWEFVFADAGRDPQIMTDVTLGTTLDLAEQHQWDITAVTKFDPEDTFVNKRAGFEFAGRDSTGAPKGLWVNMGDGREFIAPLNLVTTTTTQVTKTTKLSLTDGPVLRSSRSHFEEPRVPQGAGFGFWKRQSTVLAGLFKAAIDAGERFDFADIPYLYRERRIIVMSRQPLKPETRAFLDHAQRMKIQLGKTTFSIHAPEAPFGGGHFEAITVFPSWRIFRILRRIQRKAYKAKTSGFGAGKIVHRESRIVDRAKPAPLAIHEPRITIYGPAVGFGARALAFISMHAANVRRQWVNFRQRLARRWSRSTRTERFAVLAASGILFCGAAPGCGTSTGPVPDDGTPLPVATAPAMPSALVAEALSARHVSLRWTDRAGNEDGFNLVRTNIRTSEEVVIELSANTSSYEDRDVEPSTTYEYEVAAFNDAGPSEPSNRVRVTTPADVPTLPAPPLLQELTRPLTFQEQAIVRDMVGQLVNNANRLISPLGFPWDKLTPDGTPVKIFQPTVIGFELERLGALLPMAAGMDSNPHNIRLSSAEEILDQSQTVLENAHLFLDQFGIGGLFVWSEQRGTGIGGVVPVTSIVGFIDNVNFFDNLVNFMGALERVFGYDAMQAALSDPDHSYTLASELRQKMQPGFRVFFDGIGFSNELDKGDFAKVKVLKVRTPDEADVSAAATGLKLGTFWKAHPKRSLSIVRSLGDVDAQDLTQSIQPEASREAAEYFLERHHLALLSGMPDDDKIDVRLRSAGRRDRLSEEFIPTVTAAADLGLPMAGIDALRFQTVTYTTPDGTSFHVFAPGGGDVFLPGWWTFRLDLGAFPDLLNLVRNFFAASSFEAQRLGDLGGRRMSSGDVPGGYVNAGYPLLADTTFTRPSGDIFNLSGLVIFSPVAPAPVAGELAAADAFYGDGRPGGLAFYESRRLAGGINNSVFSVSVFPSLLAELSTYSDSRLGLRASGGPANKAAYLANRPDVRAAFTAAIEAKIPDTSLVDLDHFPNPPNPDQVDVEEPTPPEALSVFDQLGPHGPQGTPNADGLSTERAGGGFHFTYGSLGPRGFNFYFWFTLERVDLRRGTVEIDVDVTTPPGRVKIELNKDNAEAMGLPFIVRNVDVSRTGAYTITIADLPDTAALDGTNQITVVHSRGDGSNTRADYTVKDIRFIPAGFGAEVRKDSAERLPWETDTFLQLKEATGVEFVGASQETEALLRQVRIMAEQSVRGLRKPISIFGRSRSGKELVWRMLRNLYLMQTIGRTSTPVGPVVVNINDWNNLRDVKLDEAMFRQLDNAKFGNFIVLDGIEDALPHVQGKLVRILEDEREFTFGREKLDLREMQIVVLSNKEYWPDDYRPDVINRLTRKINVPPLEARVGDRALIYAYYNFHRSRQLGLTWKPITLKAGLALEWHKNRFPAQVDNLISLVEDVLAKRMEAGDDAKESFTTVEELNALGRSRLIGEYSEAASTL